MPRGEIRVKNRPARSAINPAPGGAFHMLFHRFSVSLGGFSRRLFQWKISRLSLARDQKRNGPFQSRSRNIFYQSLSQLPPKSKSQLLPLSQS